MRGYGGGWSLMPPFPPKVPACHGYACSLEWEQYSIRTDVCQVKCQRLSRIITDCHALSRITLHCHVRCGKMLTWNKNVCAGCVEEARPACMFSENRVY